MLFKVFNNKKIAVKKFTAVFLGVDSVSVMRY